MDGEYRLIRKKSINEGIANTNQQMTQLATINHNQHHAIVGYWLMFEEQRLASISIRVKRGRQPQHLSLVEMIVTAEPARVCLCFTIVFQTVLTTIHYDLQV